jgi:hypothetical protein
MRAELAGRLRRGVAACGVILAGSAMLAACTPGPPTPLFLPRPAPPPAPPPPLPPLPVEQITPVPVAPRLPLDEDPLARFPPGDNVTLIAADVDIRALLPVLAEAAGLSIVMGPEVRGRITVNLVDVPALEAIRVVMEEAELMIAPPPLRAPWGPVVFYTLPVQVQTADRELLRARFGVSGEMADWIVRNQVW